MGGYDPGMDNLLALCSALEAANQFLETAIPDVDERGKGLTEAEDDLREALSGVQTDAGALEKDVEAAEKEATEAVAELDAAAHKALETWLPALDEKVGQARDETHQELSQRTAALQAQLDELQARGFDALEAVLTQEQSELERWTTEADTAMQALVVDFEEAAEEVQRVDQQTVSALISTSGTLAQVRGEADNTLRAEMERFDKEEPEEIERRGAEAGNATAQFLQQWRSALEADAAAARESAEADGKAAAEGIEEESRLMADSVELAGTELEEAQVEFERAAADAQTTQPQVASLADLRPQIEKADEELAEIRALMQAIE